MPGGIHRNPMRKRRVWLNAFRPWPWSGDASGIAVHDMLQGEFPGTNHKKVFRLYREQGLAVRKRNKGKEIPRRAHAAGGRNSVNQT